MGLTQHPLDSIAPSLDAPSASQQNTQDPDIDLDGQPEEETRTPSSPAPALSLDSILAPAMLVDRQMRVVWQNSAAVDRIWHGAKKTRTDAHPPQLFDLLFDDAFQSRVENWQRWAAFLIRQARTMVPQEQFEQWVSRMTNHQADVISTLLAQHDASPAAAAYNFRLRQELSDGHVWTYDVVAAEFSEGLLLIYNPCARKEDSDPWHASTEIEKRIQSVGRHPHPVKRKFSVMAANLNNAAAMHLEMLPDEFSRLVSHICHRSIETIERHGGVFSKHLDSGFFAYFLPLDETEDNAMRTIACCLELKDRIAELSREWKVRKSWAHAIELNMGIHEAREHIGTLRPVAGEMVTSSGSALHMATQLSRFTRGGQIWATKSLFDTMHPDTCKQLRFGVMKTNGQSHRVFVRRCFIAMSDLPGFSADALNVHQGLEQTAVTQIFDRQL